MPFEVPWFQPSLEPTTDSLRVAFASAILSNAQLYAILGDNVFPNVVPADVLNQTTLTISFVSDVSGYDLDGADRTALASLQFTASSALGGESDTVRRLLRDLLNDIPDSLSGITIDWVEVTNSLDLPEKVSDVSDNWIYRKVLEAQVQYRY